MLDMQEAVQHYAKVFYYIHNMNLDFNNGLTSALTIIGICYEVYTGLAICGFICAVLCISIDENDTTRAACNCLCCGAYFNESPERKKEKERKEQERKRKKREKEEEEERQKQREIQERKQSENNDCGGFGCGVFGCGDSDKRIF